MKKALLLLCIAAIAAFVLSAQSAKDTHAQIPAEMPPASVYDFTVKDYNGNAVSLSAYKGKVLLIVNTATQCGLTPQYKQLQALYEKYKAEGFEVLDFPSNQFLQQAPGTDEEINNFCTVNYGTEFPRFAKIDVNGKDASPLFVWLKEQAPADTGDKDSRAFEEKVAKYARAENDSDIKWNFGKFLIDSSGKVAGRFSPAYDPAKLEKDIKKLLSQSRQKNKTGR